MTSQPTTKSRNNLLAFASALTLSVLMIPILVFGAAAAMVTALWPAFLGAYLQYGYVPGMATREAMTVDTQWWVLTGVWLSVLALVTLGLVRRRWRAVLGRSAPARERATVRSRIQGTIRARPRV